MVGAHPSMPDTFDGDRILAQTELRGVWRWHVDPGSDHRSTRMVGTREEMYLPLDKSEGLNFRTSPTFLPCQEKAEWFLAVLKFYNFNSRHVDVRFWQLSPTIQESHSTTNLVK